MVEDHFIMRSANTTSTCWLHPSVVSSGDTYADDTWLYVDVSPDDTAPTDALCRWTSVGVTAFLTSQAE